MARQQSFDTSFRAAAARALASRAAAIAASVGLVLVPVACGSDSDGGDDDAMSEPNAGSRGAAARGDGAAPGDAARDEEPGTANQRGTDPEPSAADDGAEPGAMNGEADPPASNPGESVTPGAAPSGASGAPSAAAKAFASCARGRGGYTDCDSVYVTMTQASSPRCVQLTIDNCTSGAYGRQGLPVDVPVTWQLSSASIGDSSGACELGVYYPESTVVIDASGSIEFEPAAASALPAGIVLDLELEPSRSGAELIEVVTSEPLNPARCDD